MGDTLALPWVRIVTTAGATTWTTSAYESRPPATACAIGVVTGIPMEFQFGTNWSHFSRFAGGVIGQTLAMEGCFAFFLESTFLGLFLFDGLYWPVLCFSGLV